MTKGRGLLVVLAIAAIAGGLWWWKHDRGTRAPASPASQGSGQAVSRPARGEAAHPAHTVISVRDTKGVIADATIRMVASSGEVTVIRTGNDGVARIDVEPDRWTVSASAAGHEPRAAAARELHADESASFAFELTIGGRALTGLVTDATGGVVSGARVDAAKLTAAVRPNDAVASTLTGADGRYTLTVSEGQLLVAVSSADYAPQSRFVEVGPAGATADFHLVPGGVIEGIVRDEGSRQPVGGASVAARRDTATMQLGDVARHQVIAGADGHFRLSGLRPGSYELSASAPKLTSHSPTVVGLGVAEQVTDVEILVGGGPVVRGLVVDEANAPVVGVSVHRMMDSSPHADSDARGAFVLEGLEPGHYNLIGTGGELVPTMGTPVDVAKHDVDGVRVVVRHGLQIKGHVEPRQICDVRVEPDDQAVLGPDMQITAPAVTTAADGDFTLGPLAPIASTIAARCTSGDQGKLAVHVAPGLPEQILSVSPGASIAGRVIDASGKPVTGVMVMAAPHAGNSERTRIVNGMITSGVQALSNASGAFEIRGLAAGSYRLRVLDRGRPLPIKTEANTNVTIAATEKKTGVELAVDRADGVIRGTVTGADGKPLVDAWVSVHQDIGDLIEGLDRRPGPGPGEQSSSRFVTVENNDDEGGGNGGEVPPALTDASGHFEIGGLLRAPWLVVAEAQGGKVRGRAVHITPDATVTIQALGITELTGTIRGASLPAIFTVELAGPTHAQRSFATGDGTFSFGRVDPGAYSVRVTSSAGNGEAKVEVRAGQPATVDVPLVANAVVIGKVVDPAGKPVAGIPVVVVADTGDGSLRVQLEGPPPTSGPDGSFRIEAKAGNSILVVMTPPRPVTKRGLALEAGKTLDVGPIAISGPPPQP